MFFFNNLMKSIVVCLIVISSSKAQGVQDLGVMSSSKLKSIYYNNYGINPCENTNDKVITYCVDGGSKMSFLFEFDRLNGIMMMDPYISEYRANSELEKAVNDFKVKNGVYPTYSNGAAVFFKQGVSFAYSLSVRNFKGTYYLLSYWFLNEHER